MRLLALLVVFAGVITGPVAADEVFFEPANPSSHEPVTAWAYTICPASTRGIVTRTGSTIVIDFPSLGAGCIATPTPARVPVNLGVLEGGTYSITVRLMGSERAHATLEVRGVDPVPVYPAGAPTSGRIRVYIGDDYSFSGRDVREVYFGDVPGRVLGASQWLHVEAPPHAPGIVDVTVVSRDERLVIPQSFKYSDAPGPDPFVYERLLAPVHYSGRGANESEWRTETWIGTLFGTERPILFHTPPCSTCSNEVRRLVRVDDSPRNEGLVFHVARGVRERLAASLRVREVSRQPESGGTEIPLVGMEQFRQSITFPSVPREPNQRYMLRIWAERGPDDRTDVGVLWWTGALMDGIAVTLERTADPHLVFRAVDITPLVNRAPEGEPLTLTVGGGRMWALLTVTHNETQSVTVIAPPARVR